jgi:hypothetical protein
MIGIKMLRRNKVKDKNANNVEGIDVHIFLLGHSRVLLHQSVLGIIMKRNNQFNSF